MKKLHEDMIRVVLNAPINLYFDTTPVGRILNRFSKNLQDIETSLPYTVGTAYTAVYICLSIIVLSIVVVPWVGLLYPVLIFMMVCLYKLSIAGTKEVARVESVTKSPLLSFFTESINGASTIRAFQKTEDFIEEIHIILNKNILANMWAEAVPLWFAVRIDALAVVCLFVMATVCVLARFHANAIMLSLLLTYSLNFQAVVS